MKHIAILFVVTGLFMAGCDKTQEAGESSAEAMPVVNEENCKTANIQALREDIRKKFAGKCFRQTNFQKSPDRGW